MNFMLRYLVIDEFGRRRLTSALELASNGGVLRVAGIALRGLQIREKTEEKRA